MAWYKGTGPAAHARALLRQGENHYPLALVIVSGLAEIALGVLLL